MLGHRSGPLVFELALSCLFLVAVLVFYKQPPKILVHFVSNASFSSFVVLTACKYTYIWCALTISCVHDISDAMIAWMSACYMDEVHNLLYKIVIGSRDGLFFLIKWEP